VNNKLAYVSLYQGQYYFSLTSSIVRNLIGGYDGNIYYSTWSPGSVITGGDVGKLNINPGYITLNSFKLSGTSTFVGGGVTLVLGYEGNGYYTVGGYRVGFYDYGGDALFGNGMYVITYTNYSGIYSSFRKNDGNMNQQPGLVTYDCVVFSYNIYVGAYKLSDNILRIGGYWDPSYHCSVLSNQVFRAIKKVNSFTSNNNLLGRVIVAAESSEGIWVHLVQATYIPANPMRTDILWSKLIPGIHSYSANEYDSAVDVIPYPVGSDYNYLLIVGHPNGNTLMIKLDSNGNVIW